MHFLWEQLALTDLLYISIGLSYALMLFMLLRIPGLVGKAIAVYKNSRQSSTLLLYISRFFPNKLFNLSLHTLNALTSISFALILLMQWEALPPKLSHQTVSLIVLACIIGYIFLLYLRSAFMQVWSYLFPKLYRAPHLVKQALWSLSVQIAIVKLVLFLPTLMLSSPLVTSFTLGIVCAMIVCLRSWMLINKSSETDGRYYALFLYLCTCEFAPYVCLYCIWDFIRQDGINTWHCIVDL